MHSHSFTRLLTASFFLILLFFAAAWAEPTVVDNGNQPANGLVRGELRELWRAGGEDDDVFFGTLGGVRTDPEGRLYLLDGQLSQVHIYTPDGEHLATVGREGDGPGEARNPADMFVAADGTINILQSFPGKVVKLTPEGLPAGEATFSAGAGSEGQFGVLIAGRGHGQDMILAGIRMTFGGAISTQTYFLARCDEQAQQKVALLEKEHTINYAELVMDEAAMDFIWGRMAVGQDGRVYVAPERDAYAINVLGVDGTLQKVIKREFKSMPRNEKQRQLATQIIEAVAANYPTPARQITIEDTDPVLSSIQVTEDGRIWTQTSTGNHQTPEGTWMVLDVFDDNGTFEKQVALEGDHKADRDAVILLPNGRIVVIVGALDAWLNQQGAGANAEEAPEAEPLEVICYELNEK
nr:6-bladed beta-propeller [Candidatus Krumholzibacteria bacterium]